MPDQASLLAADGSQIIPSRHDEVEYGLINVGVIKMLYGMSVPPDITIQSQLLYDDLLYTDPSMLAEARLTMQRDLEERRILARLAEGLSPPVITFTDGPIEFAGNHEFADAASFKELLEAYMKALGQLHEMNAVTAGYVDKPAANLVVRLLEVSSMSEAELRQRGKASPLRGVSDRRLYRDILRPGERSAVFGYQSWWAKHFQDKLALHFFYLNIGREGHPWLARVEIPAWVAADSTMLDDLHATLVSQCRSMGSRPYPYLLLRAHEAAVVTLEEKEQVTQMIVMELRRRGIEVGEKSYKQAGKDLGGRKAIKR
jgi:hypothetical protein